MGPPQEFGLLQVPFGFDLERIIDDWIFLCMLVGRLRTPSHPLASQVAHSLPRSFAGNDFLPHLPMLDIREGGLDFLFDTYKTVLPQVRALCSAPRPTRGVLDAARGLHYQVGRGVRTAAALSIIGADGCLAQLNLDRFERFMRELGKNEASIFAQRARDEDRMKCVRCTTCYQPDAVDRRHGPRRRGPREVEEEEEQQPEEEPSVRASPAAALRHSHSAAHQAVDSPSTPATPLPVTPAPIDKDWMQKLLESADGQLAIKLSMQEDPPVETKVPEKWMRVERQRQRASSEDTDWRVSGSGLRSSLRLNVSCRAQLKYYTSKFRPFFEDAHGAPRTPAELHASIRNLVEHYVRGLKWCLYYYYRGCRSWNWFYPFFYAPLAADIFDLVKLDYTLNMVAMPPQRRCR